MIIGDHHRFLLRLLVAGASLALWQGTQTANGAVPGAVASSGFSNVPGAAALSAGRPRLLDLGVVNGDSPFAGDRALLTTVSPNGDGFRDRAIVRFYLTERAQLKLQVFASRSRATPPAQVWSTSATLAAGYRRLAWKPFPRTVPRTYLLRLTASDAAGNRSVYGRLSPGDTSVPAGPVVRVQGVDTGFTRRSYLPGGLAYLRVATDARRLTLQFFQFGRSGDVFNPAHGPALIGPAVSEPVALDWRGKRGGPVSIPLRLGSFESGLYFARLQADDGRLGVAPFVVRPRRLGTHRVAIVLPTNTWQAYNHQDVNGDGWGDTWYAYGSIPTVDLRRPYVGWGVPLPFSKYERSFIRWLYVTAREADFLTDDDVESASTGDFLAARYDLVVFPGHEEYVTTHAYDVVTRYRNLGGNLMFLSANNFFWRVARRQQRIDRAGLWRALGRPEAALIGVQFIGNDGGRHFGRYVVTGADEVPWVFAGTGLENGDRFGYGGIEIDARSSASPRGTRLLAVIPDLQGPGVSAEMTFYRTAAGARVFAAGTLNFGATALFSNVSPVMDNLWNRLSRP